MGYWTSALGRRKRFNKIGRQHLSNILWFKEVFNNSTIWNDRAYSELLHELNTRYEGKRLPWKPLPIPNEVQWIKETCRVDNDMNIWFKGNKIGSLKHIQ